ncbi:MAG: hypothetical protein JNK76_00305 [Planctomycetales bacterium]|nr:hypothetical protein [Planctomycetales bacterium]
MPSTCQATVFYDEVGEASARLYALAAPTIGDRLLTVDELAECRFDCRVEGPTCRYSTTLQSRITLKHRGVTTWGDIPAVMAEGILPDPCPWSSELPFLYRIVGAVRLGERTVAEIDQTFGIRPLSTVRNRIVLNGKTWVPRGVELLNVPQYSLSDWRGSATAMCVTEPDDELCRESSEIGVVMMAALPAAQKTSGQTVRRLSQYPSVAFIELNCPVLESDRLNARNTLFLKRMSRTSSSQDKPDTYIWDFHDGDFTPASDIFRLTPVIVRRPVEKPESLESARAACDALQRDLAGTYDVAGYFA